MLYSGLCTMDLMSVFFQTMIVSVILPSATASRPTTNPMTTVVMHLTIVWGFSLHGREGLLIAWHRQGQNAFLDCTLSSV